MNSGRLIAIVITAATAVLVVVGTLWPIPSAVVNTTWGDASLLHASSTPEAAVQNLAHDIGRNDWKRAYSELGNKGEFTQSEFVSRSAGKLHQPAQHCHAGWLRGEAATRLRG